MASTAAVLNILVNAATGTAISQLTLLDKKLKGTAATAGATSNTIGAKFGNKAKLAGGVVAVGAAAVVAGKQLYDLGTEFDAAYDKIRAGTGATGKELEKLEGSFKNVAKNVPNDLEDVGVAVADLNTRLGLTGKPLDAMAERMLHLSNVTGDDLASNVKAVSRAFVDWEVPVKRQTNALDGLFRLSQASGASVSEIADNIQKFGSPLRTLGFTIDEAASMFANFERAGVNIQTMVPGLKLAIGNIADPTDDLAKRFKGLGIEAGKPKQALEDLLVLIGNKSHLTNLEKTTLAMEVFGKRAGADMKEAIGQGRFDVEKFLQIFRDNDGESIKKAADDTYDFAENAKILANRLKVLLEPAAREVFETLGDLSGALVGLTRGGEAASKSMERLERKNKTLADVIKVTKVAFQVAGGVLKAVAMGMVDVWRNAIGIFKGLMGVFRGIVKSVTASFNGDWRGMWAGAKETMSSALKVIFAALKTITSPFRTAFRAVKNVMQSTMGGAWDAVTGTFERGANAVIGIVRDVIEVLNLIPTVKIPLPGFVGEAPKWSQNGFQRGGPINMGKPSGDSVPALLERGEYVLNRKAVAAVGKKNLDAVNFKQAARFQTGGMVGMNIGGLAEDAFGMATGAASKVLGKGAGFFIGKLPKPDIPQPFTGVGPWAIDKATDWIRGKVKAPSDGGGPLGGASGSLAAAMRMAISHGLTITSTTGGTHAPGSYHYMGRAFDASNGSSPTPEMMSYFMDAAGKWGGSMAEHFYDPVGWYIKHGSKVPGAIGGHSDHVHTAFQRGGMVGKLRKMASGGFVGNINRTYAEHNSASGDWGGKTLPSFVVAALAEAAGRHFGIPVPGRTMEQITRGESGSHKPNSARPGATGIDPGGTKGLGLWMITTGFNDALIAKYGGEKGMLNPVKNAAAMASIYNSNGLGAWYGDGSVTSSNAHYNGNYNIKNALGGLTYGEALSGKKAPGGMSEQDKNRAAAANRRKNREGMLQKIWSRANGSENPLAKKGGLANYLKQFALYGDLDGDAKAKIIEAMKGAASTLNPAGGISKLRNTGKWMQKNVDVMGAEDGNESFVKVLERIQEKVSNRTDRKRGKKLSSIKRRGLQHPWLDNLLQNDGDRKRYEEIISIAEQNASAESGPGGSDLTDAELAEQVGLYRYQLHLLQRRKGFAAKGLGYAQNMRERFTGLLKQASKPGSPLAWKKGAFRDGLKNSKTTIGDLRDHVEELVGVTGKGGAIFDTKLKLRELGVAETLESSSQSIRDADLLALMREQLGLANQTNAILSAQLPVFQQFMPKYHSGGVIPGRTEQPIMAMGGEGVFTPDQMRAMGGTGTTNVQVFIEGVEVDPKKVDVAVDRSLNRAVRKVRTGGPVAGRSYTTNG